MSSTKIWSQTPGGPSLSTPTRIIYKSKDQEWMMVYLRYFVRGFCVQNIQRILDLWVGSPKIKIESSELLRSNKE